MKNIFYIVALALLLILTFLLGSRMILAGDFFFLADQGRDILLVKDILENNLITLIGTHSGLGGFFHGPLWLYQLIPFYLFGGGDPFAFTYAYVLLALVTVLVGFFVGENLYDKKTGLIFASLLAISPSVWSFIPNTIGVNMVPLIFLGMFYSLIRYIRGETWAYIFAIFFAGLSLQYETALPLIVIFVVGCCFFLNKKILHKPKIIFLSIFSFLLSVSTFILFDVRHNFLMFKALLSLSSNTEHGSGYMDYPTRIANHLTSLKSVYESVFITSNFLFELLLIVILSIFLFLVIKKNLYRKQDIKEIWLLAGFPIAIFVFYLFYAYPVWPEYLLGLTVPVALAYTLISQKVWRMTLGKIVIILFIVVSCIEIGNSLFVKYLSPYTPNQSAGSYKNQREVVKWILHDSKGKEFGYFVYDPTTYTYSMDYLMSWEGKNYKAKPMSEKKGTTYLILYPPLQNDEGAHAFWKKHKMRTNGKVVSKKTFTGNIIVEKLSISPNEPPVDPTYHQNLIFR